MKKVFLFLMTVAMLATPLLLTASVSRNPSIQVSVYSEHFTDVSTGTHVTARASADEINWQDVACEVTEQPGYVSCQFPEDYAGQQLIVYFSMNKILYPHIVNVPANS